METSIWDSSHSPSGNTAASPSRRPAVWPSAPRPGALAARVPFRRRRVNNSSTLNLRGFKQQKPIMNDGDLEDLPIMNAGDLADNQQTP